MGGGGGSTIRLMAAKADTPPACVQSADVSRAPGAKAPRLHSIGSSQDALLSVDEPKRIPMDVTWDSRAVEHATQWGCPRLRRGEQGLLTQEDVPGRRW